VHLFVQLDVAQLISMDIKVIKMLAGTFRASFSYLNFTMTLTLLKQLSGSSSCAIVFYAAAAAVDAPFGFCTKRRVSFNS